MLIQFICDFREAPRINSSTVDLERLKNLPEGTVGKVYHDFLEKNVRFVRFDNNSTNQTFTPFFY